MCICAVLLLAGCSKTPEEKAAKLAEEEIKKTLYFPDSYEMADLKLDSACEFQFKPEFYSCIEEFHEHEKSFGQLQLELNLAERSMDIWAPDEFSSSFERHQYASSKEKYERVLEKGQKLLEKAYNCVRVLKSFLKEKNHFAGYVAEVSYRAKNNDDNVLMGSTYIMLDKNLEKVVAQYSTSYIEDILKTMDIMLEMALPEDIQQEVAEAPIDSLSLQ